MPEWTSIVSALRGVDQLPPFMTNWRLVALVLVAPVALAIVARQWLAVCTAILLSCLAGLALLDASQLGMTIAVSAWIGGWLAAAQGVLARRRVGHMRHLESQLAALRDDVSRLHNDYDHQFLANLRQRGRSKARKSKPHVDAPPTAPIVAPPGAEVVAPPTAPIVAPPSSPAA